MKNLLLLLIIIIPSIIFGQPTKKELQDELNKQIEIKNTYSQSVTKLTAENTELKGKIEVLEKRATTIQKQLNEDPNAPVSQAYIYCKIVGTQKFLAPGVIIRVDYGEEKKWGEVIKDEEGNKKTFNTMVDALNYMGLEGWEFVQAYTVTYGSQNVYNYLMKRKV